MIEQTHEMKTRARSWFDAWAASYDASPLHRFLFQPAYLVLIEELYRAHAADPKPIHLLDIGCGTGTLGAMMVASMLPARVVGLDYAPAMCHVARRKAEQADLGDRLRFLSADSEHLPFPDRAFDVVTCSNSFHHYPHQQSVVNEIHRVLKPGGRFMLIDGFRDNVVGWVVFDVIITAVEKQVFHAPWTTIDRYFREAGFDDIRRRKFNFWFPLLLTTGAA
jgi:ubiquinone/menaquinone biosynthesis C-methylase UbiE